MNQPIFIISIILCCVSVALGRASLIGQLDYIAASQTQYPPKASISMENIMAVSMNTAIHECKKSFKWDRWNCPSSDFFMRSNSESLLLDQEDAYVKAIFTASVLYTITKNCSNGIITGCNTCIDSPYSSYCSDNPKIASGLLRQHFAGDFQDNLNGKIAHHNYRAVTILLEKSLNKHCTCAFWGMGGKCSKEICIEVLKPFEEIAAGVRQMYDEGLQLDNNGGNSRILWHNIPLDVLLYVKDSPNYCEPEAILHWNGMIGRQCSAKINGENLTEEELTRCRHLCLECGYTVVKRNVVNEKRCHCKIIWGFQVHCEMCVTVKKQYICY